MQTLLYALYAGFAAAAALDGAQPAAAQDFYAGKTMSKIKKVLGLPAD